MARLAVAELQRFVDQPLRGQPLAFHEVDIDATDAAHGQPAQRVVIVEQRGQIRSEEHTSELQSLMRISYAVFCLKKKKNQTTKKLLTRLMIDKMHTRKRYRQCTINE